MIILPEEVKYINDNPANGIIVDWKKVFDYYNKLKVPKGIYNPAKELDPAAAEWFILISSRSTGKTTNLFLCMVLQRHT